jgi:hypothetical protein
MVHHLWNEGVTGVSQGYHEVVTGMLQGCYKGATRVLQHLVRLQEGLFHRITGALQSMFWCCVVLCDAIEVLYRAGRGTCCSDAVCYRCATVLCVAVLFSTMLMRWFVMKVRCPSKLCCAVRGMDLHTQDVRTVVLEPLGTIGGH